MPPYDIIVRDTGDPSGSYQQISRGRVLVQGMQSPATDDLDQTE